MEKDILELTSMVDLQLALESEINNRLEIEDQSVFYTLLNLSSEINTDCPIQSNVTLEIRGT
jgi:hypothetical protein